MTAPHRIIPRSRELRHTFTLYRNPRILYSGAASRRLLCLPDYCVYAPVFDDQGKLVCLPALQSHQGDTGGKSPGGFSVDAMDIWTEGLAIPCLKLVHRGKKRRDVIEMLVRNNRFPSFAGDIAAMIGAIQAAVKSLEELIAKHGADVVRVESPRGREFRPAGATQDDYFFLSSNRGKRSLALDLAREQGRALVRRILPRFDVLVENFRPGVMEAMGLGADALRALAPRLVYCGIDLFEQPARKTVFRRPATRREKRVPCGR